MELPDDQEPLVTERINMEKEYEEIDEMKEKDKPKAIRMIEGSREYSAN